MSYRMDAQAARGLLADYMGEDDDEVTSPERVGALADALHDALREIEGHREHDAGSVAQRERAGAAAPARLLALVEGEVEQTTENNDAPDAPEFADYLSDLVYRLVGELAVVVTGNDEAGVDVANAVAEAIDHATEPHRTTTED